MKRLFLLIALAVPVVAAADSTVFLRALSGVTVPTVTTPLRNVGQGMHLIAVFYPGQAAAVTSGVQVRIEASFDNTRWFPITKDVTTTSHVAGSPGYAYAIERGNGSFPFVRIAALQTPADKPLTVWYTGDIEPLGQVMLQDGRYLPSAPGGSSDTRLSWVLCDAGPCSVTTRAANPQIVTKAGTISKCHAAANTAPLGADLVLDITRGGSTVLPPAKFHLPAGASYASFSGFAIAATEGDLLQLAITQVGTTEQGQGVSLVCVVQ